MDPSPTSGEIRILLGANALCVTPFSSRKQRAERTCRARCEREGRLANLEDDFTWFSTQSSLHSDTMTNRSERKGTTHLILITAGETIVQTKAYSKFVREICSDNGRN